MCTAVIGLCLGGAYALADDTELLLATSSGAEPPPPNVLFILDTSGSMKTTVGSSQPYDPANTYGGACASDRLYWSYVGTKPVCDGSETQYVVRTAFYCDRAQRAFTARGSFKNTLIQYRSDAGAAESWNTLLPGNHTDSVECKRDRGRHGDGTVDFVYAIAAAGTNYAWTDDEDLAVSWGSAPRNTTYTFYDGNHLNWESQPQSIPQARIDVMKRVITSLLESNSEPMNIGVMRFHQSHGGVVINAMQDLDTNRASIVDSINALPASGFTPLSETMYEAAQYWLGANSRYNNAMTVPATDPHALSQLLPYVYDSPATEACAKNFNVLLTDGKPTEDKDTPMLVPLLPDYKALMGRGGCTFITEGDCLDDITEYLSLHDVGVTTHTVGFSVDLPILQDAATNSGGSYFLANDLSSLSAAFTEIFANINDRSFSFSAPAVSVNTFNRTRHLNDLYFGVFGAQAKQRWPGNLKKFQLQSTRVVNADNSVTFDNAIVDDNGNDAVDPATGMFTNSSRSFWTVGGPDGNDVRLGGAAHKLPIPTDRNLYTNRIGVDLSLGTNHVSPTNSGAFSLADFGLTGGVGEPTIDEMIRWMRGEDVNDDDNDPNTTVRKAMGDPLHARPATVIYGGTAEAPEVVVFVATNDGYLHAIDANTGIEMWSFVPFDLLSMQSRLFLNATSNYKSYGLDGNVVVALKDENKNGIIDNNDFVYLIFGMRRGGNDYFALDVTDRNAPELLWTRSLTAAGQSWSTPALTRMTIDGPTQNADKAVLVIGGGYDPVHDTLMHPSADDGMGNGVHILDLESGNTLWRGGARNSGADREFDDMNRAIPGDVLVIDLDSDGYADRMYSADMGGQVWRFDVINGEAPPALINGGVIAQLGGQGLSAPGAVDSRRFYNTPDASILTDTRQQRQFISLSIGSGYRAHPLDTTVTERFYSLRDPDVFSRLRQQDYDNYNVIVESDLVEVSGSSGSVITVNDRGWKLTLPADEMVLSKSLTFDNTISFVAFSPSGAADTECAGSRGRNILYRVNIANGDPVVPDLDTLLDDDADAARRTELEQGGIAPAPIVLFPSLDVDALEACSGPYCTPPPITCIGAECRGTDFINRPIRTVWTMDGIE